MMVRDYDMNAVGCGELKSSQDPMTCVLSPASIFSFFFEKDLLCDWRERALWLKRDLCGWRESSVAGERSLCLERDLCGRRESCFLLVPFLLRLPLKIPGGKSWMRQCQHFQSNKIQLSLREHVKAAFCIELLNQ